MCSVLFQCMLGILSIAAGYRSLSPMVPPRMGSPHCQDYLDKQKGMSCLTGDGEDSSGSWAKNYQN